MKEIDLYKQMMATAASAGIAVIPRRKAAMLLALCYAFGDEPFVFNEKLRTDTLTAARLYGITDGGTVDPEFAALLNAYHNDVRNNKADWKAEIEKEYDLSFPEYKDGGICISEGLDWKARRRQSADWGRCPGEAAGADD